MIDGKHMWYNKSTQRWVPDNKVPSSATVVMPTAVVSVPGGTAPPISAMSTDASIALKNANLANIQQSISQFFQQME